LKTPGTPIWAMKAIKPKPTKVTAPSNPIVVLRSRDTMLSPITPERIAVREKACRTLEGTNTTIGHGALPSKFTQPKHPLLGR
jgi:hypothetical protein